MSALTHSYYKNLAVSSYYDYNNYNQDGNGQESGDAQVYQALASVRSFSVIFAGLYTMILAGSLSFFGGMCCVGFISFKGKYVRPIWTGTDSSNVSPKNLGIFLGTLVLFSNLCLVIAVVLGEFQVGNYLDEKEKEELGNFAIEKTANLLGTMSMFLSVLYALYSIMLFTSMRELLEPKNQNQRLGYIAPRGTIA
jgi:hypothetical protein